MAGRSGRSIYRSEAGRREVLALYDAAVGRLDIPTQSRTVGTRFGQTHLLAAGPEGAPPLVIFQGGNVVNPMTLRWFEPLAREHRVYAPDTVGHPGKSAETRITPPDRGYGEWVVDLLDGLGVEKADFVGPSFGAGIILRAAAYAPERISRAALVVPAGLATGPMRRMLREIVAPMLLYRLAPRRERLARAVGPMFTEPPEEDVLEVCGAVFRHVKLETRMPKQVRDGELAGFASPTLLIAAEDDIFFPAERVIERARAVIPNLVAAESLAGSGHYPSREGISRVNERVRRFLKDGR